MFFFCCKKRCITCAEFSWKHLETQVTVTFLIRSHFPPSEWRARNWVFWLGCACRKSLYRYTAIPELIHMAQMFSHCAISNHLSLPSNRTMGRGVGSTLKIFLSDLTSHFTLEMHSHTKIRQNKQQIFVLMLLNRIFPGRGTPYEAGESSLAKIELHQNAKIHSNEYQSVPFVLTPLP